MSIKCAPPPAALRRQHGLTLAELMVSLALGLLVALAAATLLQQTADAYRDIDDGAGVQDTGRMALAHLADALRQAGHLPQEAAPPLSSAAALGGIDDSRDAGALDPAQGNIRAAGGNGYNKSDILMVGYFGAPPHAGGSIVNCSGAAAAAAPLQDAARSWVIYYIAPGIGNEPELRCRYRGKHGAWTSDAVARGVEAMQLRYGIDSDLDGQADRWQDASDIDGPAWQRVRLVRIALLVRGERRQVSPVGAAPRAYRLFSDAAGAPDDAAWRYTEQHGERRLRSVFRTTVFLRNAPPVAAIAAGAAP